MIEIPLEFKAGQILIVTILCIYVYYVIYQRLCGRSPREAFYLSATSQTLSGGGIVPKHELEQLIISSQCILASLISAGIIIITFKGD